MATSETFGEGTILGGVDTHKEIHAAAAMSETGRLLGTAEFPTTPVGYRRLLAWLRSFGPVERVGIEGTGSYGAGLCRYLRSKDVEVVEVNRPNRRWRRRRGTSDPADAEAAARAVLAGEAIGAPKSQDGAVEAIHMLRVARRSAIKARTQAANQLRRVVETAPVPLREKLRALSIPRLPEGNASSAHEPAPDLAPTWPNSSLFVPVHHKCLITARIASLLDPKAAQGPHEVVRPAIQEHDVRADVSETSKVIPDSPPVAPPEMRCRIATQISPGLGLQVGRIEEDQIGRFHKIQRSSEIAARDGGWA